MPGKNPTLADAGVAPTNQPQNNYSTSNKNSPPTDNKKLLAQERRTQVWALRLSGASVRAIAQQIGISKSRVHTIIVSELDNLRKERERIVDKYLDMELARIDRLLLAVMPAAQQGDLDAVGEARKLIETKAKMLGLNAPSVARIEHTGADGEPIATRDENIEWLVGKVKKIRERQDGEGELPDQALLAESERQPPIFPTSEITRADGDLRSMRILDAAETEEGKVVVR